MHWAKTNGTKIDTAVFFINLAIEEMVKSKFNLRGPVAMYESTESRSSPLMVIPRTKQEIEEYIRMEEAEDISQRTRTQAGELQMKKIYPRRPPRN